VSRVPASEATHRIDGDFIEAGSWAVAAAVTGGAVEVRGARALDLEPILAVLSRFGVRCEVEDGRLRVLESALEGAGRVTTGVWPGFPTDMVSLVTVLAALARGTTLVHDWLYELRVFALEQLSGMGADLFLCDPHRIVVTGPRRLRGRTLDSRDIRSGMALVMAALAAEGTSRIESLETIERGYARLVRSAASAPTSSRRWPRLQAQKRPSAKPSVSGGARPNRLLRARERRGLLEVRGQVAPLRTPSPGQFEHVVESGTSGRPGLAAPRRAAAVRLQLAPLFRAGGPPPPPAARSG
jgi:hypothetical protein